MLVGLLELSIQLVPGSGIHLQAGMVELVWGIHSVMEAERVEQVRS